MTGNKYESNADDYTRSGFIAGMLRGQDSAGIASIDITQQGVAWQKLPLPGLYLTKDKLGDQLIRDARKAKQVTICHTRAATQGGVTLNNTHPFYVNDDNGTDGWSRELIGVHNGTLDLWKSKKNGSRFEVDSEWALNRIFDEGLDAFEEFSGAFCFVWWDSADPDCLNFALNNQRPMHVAITDNGALMYASEAEMLYWLCRRHNIKLTDQGVMSLEAGHYYKFDSKDVSNPTKAKLPTFKSTYTAGTTNHVNHSRYSNAYSTPTHMENVAELLSKVVVSEEAQPEGTRAASREEIGTARAMGWLGEKGRLKVTRIDADSKIVYGEFSSTQYPLEANGQVRNMNGVKVDDVFETTIVGVIDDGTDLELVCTKPRATPLTKEPVTVH